MLAGVVAGLLIHFARDIAEGPPGVRMLWPIQLPDHRGRILHLRDI
jgi:hypothetical protein